jgi:hypothetical protein
MTLAVLGRAVVAFAGCATTWNRADSTQSDLDQDVAACRYASAMLPYRPVAPIAYPASFADPGAGDLMASNQLAALSASLLDWAAWIRTTNECLEAKGWVRDD